VAKETGRNRVIRFDGNEFNAHQQGKGNNSSDGEKQVKGSASANATPGAPPRAKSSADSPRASA
jgi:hypothetical protein